MYLVNVANGLYLESNSGGSIYTNGFNNGNSQKWAYEGDKLRNVEFYKYLDSDYQNNVYASVDTGYNNLNWIKE